MGYDNRLNKRAGYCVPCGLDSKQEEKPKKIQLNTFEACCKKASVRVIARVKDTVFIMFDDCSFLQAGLEVLDKSLTMEDDFPARVVTLESNFKKLTDNLVDITGLDGELSHLAINKKFKE